jgi:hypothetical protein
MEAKAARQQLWGMLGTISGTLCKATPSNAAIGACIQDHY